jgi:hypothetical protein
VLNNNFVNYNYYINDIRQSNFGSQTQKIPPKKKNPTRAEGIRKKNQRVKSEINVSKGIGKKNINKMSDQDKLKYFEKYKKKFGVDYKAELNKRKQSKGGGERPVAGDNKGRRKNPNRGNSYGGHQSTADFMKNKLISERQTGRVEKGEGVRVKSYRKPETRQKKSKENFIKRNMKLIREAKKKNENRMAKAMKTGELERNISRTKKDQYALRHKKSKSQIVSRKSEKVKMRGYGKKGPKAVIKGEVDMGVIMGRMERDKARKKKEFGNESKISENWNKNESIVSKNSQNRPFLSRSPMTKKPSMEQKIGYKTMQSTYEKKEVKKPGDKKKKYVLSSMKEKRRNEENKRKQEEEQRKRDKVKQEKGNRKEVAKMGNSLIKKDFTRKQTKEGLLEEKVKQAKKVMNKSGILPQNVKKVKQRETTKSFDPFLENPETKKSNKKIVLFSDLRGK